jgi:hypothetical protein
VEVMSKIAGTGKTRLMVVCIAIRSCHDPAGYDPNKEIFVLLQASQPIMILDLLCRDTN